MKSNLHAIVPPAVPKVLPDLDEWAGQVTAELELEQYVARDVDFSSVQWLEIVGCKLVGVSLAGAKFTKLQVGDVVLSRIEAAGVHALEAAWLRAEIRDGRFTGADFGEALFEDCTFENVKFDEAGFRFATFKQVWFLGCVLRNADFSGAKLSNVYFSGCELDAANFDNATCKSVDLRGENLANIKGVFGLKGATISSEQLIQLAPRLATSVGLDVDYET